MGIGFITAKIKYLGGDVSGVKAKNISQIK